MTKRRQTTIDGTARRLRHKFFSRRKLFLSLIFTLADTFFDPNFFSLIFFPRRAPFSAPRALFRAELFPL